MKTPNEAVIWWGKDRTVMYVPSFVLASATTHNGFGPDLLPCKPRPLIPGSSSLSSQSYNDAYIATIGDKHPAQFGQPAAVAWGEVRGKSDAPVSTTNVLTPTSLKQSARFVVTNFDRSSPALSSGQSMRSVRPSLL
jgi:hypothetical protein